MIENISISNKWCYFELSIYQKYIFLKGHVTQKTEVMAANFYLYIFPHRNKLHFKIYSKRILQIFPNITVFFNQINSALAGFF